MSYVTVCAPKQTNTPHQWPNKNPIQHILIAVLTFGHWCTPIYMEKLKIWHAQYHRVHLYQIVSLSSADLLLKTQICFYWYKYEGSLSFDICSVLFFTLNNLVVNLPISVLTWLQFCHIVWYIYIYNTIVITTWLIRVLSICWLVSLLSVYEKLNNIFSIIFHLNQIRTSTWILDIEPGI